MLRLYKKNKLGFSLAWIGIYVVLLSVADSLSGAVGVEKLVTAPLAAVLSIILWLWLRRHELQQEHGLRSFRGNAKRYLYFLPLVVICSCNLWLGVGFMLSPWETVLYLLSMLCVGFLEEVIFRGLLYRALQAEGVRFAILISGATFGLGHIVNLLSGAEFLPTLLQICYAAAIGVLFTVIFHKSGSLIPCIVSHCVVNILSVFAQERTGMEEIVVAILLIVISLSYAAWIWKKAD